MALIAGFAGYFVGKLIAPGNTDVAGFLMCGLAIAMDGYWRSSRNQDEEDRTWVRMLKPSLGGHLMFIPLWIIGAVALIILIAT